MTNLVSLRELSAETGYSGFPLDRLSDKRDDLKFVRSLQADPAARTLIIARDMPVAKRAGATLDPWFSLPEAAAVGEASDRALLGTRATGPVFATLLSDEASSLNDTPAESGFLDHRAIRIPGRSDLEIQDLRSLALAGAFDGPTTAMMACAKSLLYWHARHKFCSCCGEKSYLAAAGWRRECPACHATHFPRTDPVVIMLGIDGERCLLGRQPRFPKGMYSALAGFLEPGETIEEAVRREIREESGVICSRVQYLASQPWPFPASLMIGCIATAVSTEIIIDRTELEDARWFSRAEARAMIEGRRPHGLTAPHPLAIAHYLLRAWAFPEPNGASGPDFPG